MGNLLSPFAGAIEAGSVIITPEMFGAVGDGITDDSIALQKWLNAASNALYMPPKKYLHNETLIFKNLTRLQGAIMDPAGSSGSMLYYTGSSDQSQINNPINSSSNACIYVYDVAFVSENLNVGKANISSIGGHYIETKRCGFSGTDFGIIHDQDELTSDEDNVFNLAAGGTAGIWYVNGPAHTPGADTFYTNVNRAIGNEFFGSIDGIGIADDGGANHVFINNNFNQLDVGIRANSTYGMVITGNEFDGCVTAGVLLAVTPIAGVVGGTNYAPNISTNTFAGIGPGVKFVTASCGGLTYSTNLFNTSTSCDNLQTVNGLLSSSTMLCQGNYQLDVGSSPTNNFNVVGTFVPTWISASGAQPVLGNGTIIGSYMRNGNSVTVRILLTMGSTTTYGADVFEFGNLPFLGGGPNSTFNLGTIVAIDVSAGTYNLLAASMGNGSVFITGQPNGATSQMSPTVPFTFAVGDRIEIFLTYQTWDFK